MAAASKSYSSALCWLLQRTDGLVQGHPVAQHRGRQNSHWNSIQSIRHSHDKGFVRWLPHMNLLYPFASLVDDGVAARVVTALQDVKPFKVTFKRTLYFQHSASSFTLWLSPEGAELSELQAKLWQAFPGFDDLNSDPGRGITQFTPHLSVGQFPSKKQLEGLQKEFEAAWEPVTFTISEVALITRASYLEPFCVQYRVPLGGGGSVTAQQCAHPRTATGGDTTKIAVSPAMEFPPTSTAAAGITLSNLVPTDCFAPQGNGVILQMPEPYVANVGCLELVLDSQCTAVEEEEQLRVSTPAQAAAAATAVIGLHQATSQQRAAPAGSSASSEQQSIGGATAGASASSEQRAPAGSSAKPSARMATAAATRVDSDINGDMDVTKSVPAATSPSQSGVRFFAYDNLMATSNLRNLGIVPLSSRQAQLVGDYRVVLNHRGGLPNLQSAAVDVTAAGSSAPLQQVNSEAIAKDGCYTTDRGEQGREVVVQDYCYTTDGEDQRQEVVTQDSCHITVDGQQGTELTKGQVGGSSQPTAGKELHIPCSQQQAGSTAGSPTSRVTRYNSRQEIECSNFSSAGGASRYTPGQPVHGVLHLLSPLDMAKLTLHEHERWPCIASVSALGQDSRSATQQGRGISKVPELAAGADAVVSTAASRAPPPPPPAAAAAAAAAATGRTAALAGAATTATATAADWQAVTAHAVVFVSPPRRQISTSLAVRTSVVMQLREAAQQSCVDPSYVSWLDALLTDSTTTGEAETDASGIGEMGAETGPAETDPAAYQVGTDGQFLSPWPRFWTGSKDVAGDRGTTAGRRKRFRKSRQA